MDTSSEVTVASYCHTEAFHSIVCHIGMSFIDIFLCLKHKLLQIYFMFLLLFLLLLLLLLLLVILILLLQFGDGTKLFNWFFYYMLLFPKNIITSFIFILFFFFLFSSSLSFCWIYLMLIFDVVSVVWSVFVVVVTITFTLIFRCRFVLYCACSSIENSINVILSKWKCQNIIS